MRGINILFENVGLFVMFNASISYTAAFTAGLLSFFSPCIVPLVPAYFTFITGASLDDLVGTTNYDIRKKTIHATLFFVLGFTLVFVLLGASASAIGGIFMDNRHLFRIFGGSIVIFLGLHLLGVFRLNFLDMEKRFLVRKRPVRVVGSFFVGMAFGAGWTPCIGPLLGSILILAGGEATVGRGMVLLLIFAAGLAVPFLILSFFVHAMLGFVNKTKAFLGYANRIAGIFLVIIGILLVAGRLSILYPQF